ncbi:hypothetical protein LCGC14_2339770, partial [marine sediment metagenome]
MWNRCKSKTDYRPKSFRSDDKNLPNTIKTTRNGHLCNFLKRLIALFFDSIIIGAIGSVFSWFLFTPWLPSLNILDPFGGFWYSVPFDFIFGFLYHWGLETYNKGQTLGKMALNIRTVDEKTLQIAKSSNYAVNNILKGSPFLILD